MLSHLNFTESNVYDYSDIVSGADINSGSEIDTWHEFQNLSNTGIVSELSCNGETAIQPTTRDILAHQYVYEVKQAIYKDGLHSGSVAELEEKPIMKKYQINNNNKFDFR